MFLRRCEYVNEWFWLPSKRKTNFGKNDAGGTCLKSGIHISFKINKIELGLVDVPQSKIVAIANALNTTPFYLMGIESPQQKNDTIADVVIRLQTFRSCHNETNA